jgi:nucleotide-binding universal stress UspA family protein
MLVLGSRGLSGITGLLTGSVAQAVMTRTSQPVVLVRAGHTAEDEHLPDEDGRPSTRTAPRDVVLGIDLGEESDDVIRFAFESARARGAGLRVVHTWETPPPLTLGPGEIGLEARPQQAEEWRGFLTALLQTWTEKFPEVEVTEVLAEGRASAHLADASSRAGLLVIGRRIREGRFGLRTGPVTQTMVQHADCPVAVVAHD